MDNKKIAEALFKELEDDIYMAEGKILKTINDLRVKYGEHLKIRDVILSEDALSNIDGDSICTTHSCYLDYNYGCESR